MKEFKDLTFIDHPSKGYGFDTQAKMFFGNGYGVSVITGGGAYGSSEEYEAAVILGNEDNWDICYDTPVTDDVIGYCDETRISEIMKEIQNLQEQYR